MKGLKCNHVTRDIRIDDCPNCRLYYLENKVNFLEQRIDKAVKMVHNIRRYSEIYTPIKEGCEDVLRVLKGRDS
jgi:hypothetical protein